jgi:hypothetical protein
LTLVCHSRRRPAWVGRERRKQIKNCPGRGVGTFDVADAKHGRGNFAGSLGRDLQFESERRKQVRDRQVRGCAAVGSTRTVGGHGSESPGLWCLGEFGGNERKPRKGKGRRYLPPFQSMLMFPRLFSIVLDCFRCFRLFSIVFDCVRLFSNVLECSRLFSNVLECSRMFSNVLYSFSSVLSVSPLFPPCSPPQIAEEGGVKPIISVLRSPFVEVQREAGRALANLAASAANQAIIIEGGGHQLLISYLLSPDTACQVRC